MASNSSHFSIVQFTDLHFGESYRLDRQTEVRMRQALELLRPDFVVFTGDLISGYAVPDAQHAVDLWGHVVGIVASYGVPFATVFGNHDDQPYHLDPLMWQRWAVVALILVLITMSVFVLQFSARANRVKVGCVLSLIPIIAVLYTTRSTKAQRIALIDRERALYPGLSRTRVGPRTVDGVSNYRIEERGVSMVFLDSGGGMLLEGVHWSQLAWLGALPPTDFAFVHMPPVQFESAYKRWDRCEGRLPLELPSVAPNSEFLLPALRKLGVRALFVGHDHGNAHCCDSDESVRLCYGQHSGYAGYSLSSRHGARLIVVDRATGEFSTTAIESFGRLAV